MGFFYNFSYIHSLLNCRCSLNAIRIPRHERLALKVDDLLNWEHFDNMEKLKEIILKQASEKLVTFLFRKETEEYREEPQVNDGEIAVDLGGDSNGAKEELKEVEEGAGTADGNDDDEEEEEEEEEESEAEEDSDE
jgi:hypothetical protein